MMSVATLYNEWLSATVGELHDELLSMNDKQKEEAFCQNIEFGTGGLRGILGAGINRMNIYTVRKVTKGYAEYITASGKDAMLRGVAIAYDNRRMSSRFAREVANVLSENGIKVYLFDTLRPTPELSFAVRELHAFGGIVITASHNPPEYNGYKIYDENGCQLVPRYTDVLIDIINSVPIDLYSEPQGNSELIEIIGENIDNLYYERVAELNVNPDVKKDIKIVYSAQHGAGNIPVREVLKRCGYDVRAVEEQCYPDTEFSNTKNPNPETAEAFELSLKIAKSENADIILVTDPDCDRVGTAILHDGEYLRMTGNQMGAVLLEYILSFKQKTGDMPKNGMMINTIVTSDLGDSVARLYGLEVEKTLTGFKFIGDRIEHHNLTDKKTFVFGYEESYGYLLGDFVRDKDAVQAALIIAEACAYYKSLGLTLIDVLNGIYERHDYYVDNLVSITKPGLDGAAEIEKIMKSLRADPPKTIAAKAVVRIEDYTTSVKAADHIPSSNVLKYFLDGGSWVAIRPSGTEPKCKIYYSAKAESKCLAETLLVAMKADIASLME